MGPSFFFFARWAFRKGHHNRRINPSGSQNYTKDDGPYLEGEYNGVNVRWKKMEVPLLHLRALPITMER